MVDGHVKYAQGKGIGTALFVLDAMEFGVGNERFPDDLLFDLVFLSIGHAYVILSAIFLDPWGL